MPRPEKDFVERLPEAESAVADGNFRGNLQPALFDVDHELAPALRALPPPDLKADQFLFAFLGSARTRFATRPSARKPPQATGWARPCKAASASW